MLVDLPANWRELIPENEREYQKMLRELHEEWLNPQMRPIRLAQGVYLDHLNFDHEIEHLTWDRDNNRYDYATSVLRLWTHEVYQPEAWPTDLFDPEIVQVTSAVYGVCDHWTQVLLRFPQLQNSEIPYLLRLSSIRKAHQPEHGGWRWHKWGQYIGVFQEQARNHEYLYDTPDVEEVFTYEVHEMRYPW